MSQTTFLPATPARKSRSRPRLYALRRDKEGWWLYGEPITPDVPWWGPWGTKGEAIEVRNSYIRNNINSLHPRDIKSEWRGRRRGK